MSSILVRIQSTFAEATEKREISDYASAGTDIFRDLFYICPLFNGVRDQGKEVVLEPVRSVIDIKTGSN